MKDVQKNAAQTGRRFHVVGYIKFFLDQAVIQPVCRDRHLVRASKNISVRPGWLLPFPEVPGAGVFRQEKADYGFHPHPDRICV